MPTERERTLQWVDRDIHDAIRSMRARARYLHDECEAILKAIDDNGDAARIYTSGILSPAQHLTAEGNRLEVLREVKEWMLSEEV